MRPGFLGFRIDFDIITFLQCNSEFERVDRIQSQALAKERRLGCYIIGGNIFELQCRDDELFDFLFYWVGYGHNSPYWQSWRGFAEVTQLPPWR
jgi:hypothetical protein